MKEIYLDNAATTRVDTGAAELALRVMQTCYGNPSSLHSKGTEAARLLDKARGQVAALLGCAARELVFCSGGTEANNLALLGAASARRHRGKTIVVSTVEHSSVLKPLAYLEARGWTIRRVTPLTDGRAAPEAMLAAVDADTVLLSAMLVSSETGSVSALDRISAAARRKQPEILIHCDAVQGFGKLPFTPKSLGADLVSVSGHKIYAPKGSGALYVRSGVRLNAVLHGGSQEAGLRPGTENLPAICGMGASAEKLRKSRAKIFAHARAISEHFVNYASQLEGVCINSPADASPYICNISVPGWRSQILLNYLSERGIYVSSGSACSKGARSRVLTAMGLPHSRVDSALRVSFSKDSELSDVDAFFGALKSAMRDILKAN